ncbi:polysaccharide deacetylase family protein [Paenibacillus sp. NEAU-GSW1]|uniref:polysaccharide deacetylase family protein n=1 Tax=Paenibacillus sp. NEAU-GSW1 TaxID=2682486 RepID=UPI0012E0E71B|nr:polysaccharide deacetylase family protein [Paenibacillus sp. NEAU-GSW1]MUT65512.1 polysaccharide deacetylase family protein [Paenibacillus sp. NEAU-GSW1]
MNLKQKRRRQASLLGAAAVIAATALLAGCGGAAQTNSKDKGSDQPSSAAESPAPSPTEQAKPASPSPTAAPEASASTAPAISEPAKPLYKMSSVYRFSPIEEGTEKKVVLLTFDDGPKDEAVLTSMLDTLDKHKAKAIFFVNGYRVKQNPELLKLIHERGQTIGNHSWDHIDLKKENEEKIEQQIGDVQKDVEAIVGEPPRFFRPPYGSGGDKVKEIAKNHGLLFMTWSNGSLDWEQKSPGKPDEVIANVLDQLHPGANILMHELGWTAEALDGLLTKLEEKGYGFIDPSTIELP